MSRVENGTVSSYLNINLNTKIKNGLNNSCFVNLIFDHFQDQFDNKKNKFKLTPESLCKLCEIEYKNESIGLSINKLLALFRKFKTGLCVYGPFGSIRKYKPGKRNKNTNKNHLYIYVHNNHCYKIINDVKKFEQVVWKGEFTRKLIV